MATKPLKTITFPGLPDTYTIPQVDPTPVANSLNAVASGAVKKLDDFVKAGLSIVKVNLKSLMIDHDKVYLYTGSETGESTGYWYYYNGTQFVPGGLYGAGIQIDSTPTQGSTNAVSSGGVYSALDALQAQIPQIDSTLSQSGQAADAKVVGDDIASLNEGYLLFDIVQDSYITTAGVITPYAGWSRTDYIECSEYDTLEVESTVGSASMYNVFYDENKTFISGTRFRINPGANTFAIPENAAYFILSNSTAAVENYKLSLNVTSVEIVGYTNPYYNLNALNGMEVTFKFDTITFLLNKQIVTKTWDDLKAEIPGAYQNVDDAKMRDVGYTYNTRYRLIVDKLGRFKWTTNTQNTANTVIGADVSDGDYEHPTRAFGTLTEQVQQKVFNVPRKLQEELPLDVVIELDAKEDALYSKFDDSDFVMGYYSDNHMYGFEVGVETPMTTLALSRYDKHIDFDSILCCGDSVLSGAVYQNDGSPYTALINANFMLDRNKLLFVEGNHDRNIIAPVMPTKDFINLMYRPLKRQDGVHFGGNGRPYFYRDFTDRKIRIICLDLYDVLPDENYNYHSGYKQNQMEWLANTALNVPDSGWHVLVATHVAPYGESDGMTDNGTPPYNSNVLIGILESFKNGTSVTINSTATIEAIPAYSITTNFSNAGNLIGCFVGHNHVDVDLVKNGIHYVSIECGYVEYNDKDYRTPFSYSAIAFDVVVINTANKSVKFYRIGYGENREFNY